MAQQKSSPNRCSMHVKKGDTVQVIAGRDKAKVGEVLEVLPKKARWSWRGSM